MANKIYYLETGSLDPAYNLAFEEYVLRYCIEGDYLLLWQNDNTIVVGSNQNTEEEINRSYVEAHQIRVVRRNTGGGAVYHDLGNLNYSFITDVGEADKVSIQRFTEPVIAALRALGVQAEASGRNDILAEGRKVSGTAQQVVNGRILHHGTLLFDSKSDVIANALNVAPEKFQSKSTKSVRGRVGNIRDLLKTDMDMSAFWRFLKESLSGDYVEEITLPEEALSEIWMLKKEKYDTWEWNFGRSPKYALCNKRYFKGGGLEVRIDVEKGNVADIVFYGDFLAVQSMETVTALLKGCPFRENDFREVLKKVDLKSIFGTITMEEILETVFHISG